MLPGMALHFAARTDRGLVRSGNQDSLYVGDRLLAVADGMGGMAAGDVASRIVIEAIAPLDKNVPDDGAGLVAELRAAVQSANRHLRDAVDADPALEGMGTTLTAVLFAGPAMGLAHVGDSRGYLLGDGRLTQLTRDDTYVQGLVEKGVITVEEAGRHPQRSMVTRVLQGRPVDPAYSTRELVAGERLLLCTDGLSNVVGAEAIGEVLRECPGPDSCADRLIELALQAGAPDNVTVIVADVLADEGEGE
jgi:protein phosphatase